MWKILFITFAPKWLRLTVYENWLLQTCYPFLFKEKSRQRLNISTLYESPIWILLLLSLLLLPIHFDCFDFFVSYLCIFSEIFSLSNNAFMVWWPKSLSPLPLHSQFMCDARRVVCKDGCS